MHCSKTGLWKWVPWKTNCSSWPTSFETVYSAPFLESLERTPCSSPLPGSPLRFLKFWFLYTHSCSAAVHLRQWKSLTAGCWLPGEQPCSVLSYLIERGRDLTCMESLLRAGNFAVSQNPMWHKVVVSHSISQMWRWELLKVIQLIKWSRQTCPASELFPLFLTSSSQSHFLCIGWCATELTSFPVQLTAGACIRTTVPLLLAIYHFFPGWLVLVYFSFPHLALCPLPL